VAKLDNNSLKDLSIFQWADIRDRYKEADLFLGNGFSIKISDRLNYRSLFESFINNLQAGQRPSFGAFGTTNFELILEKINNAISVNAIFNIQNGVLIPSIELLRNGLIQAISQNHPRHAELEEKVFTRLSIELDGFGDIFTTNYDTFLYRIIMQTRDRYRAAEKIRCYQDYFWLSTGDFLQFMDVQNYDEI
jgi:hypothetical protein